MCIRDRGLVAVQPRYAVPKRIDAIPVSFMAMPAPSAALTVVSYTHLTLPTRALV